MTVLCIYHAECNDGVTAAWVVRQKYPDAVLHGARHGDPPPDVSGKDVIIVDFSYPVHIMWDMMKVCRSFTILDHHKSAKEAWDAAVASSVALPALVAVFDMDRSGAGIAWDHFFPGSKRPILIDRVEDNDLWRFKYEDTRAFVEALRSFSLTVESVDLINRLTASSVLQYDAFIALGRNIRAFKDEMVSQAASQAHQVEFAGFKVWAANVPYFLSSDVAHRLIRDRAFGVTYYRDDKLRWHISLRSEDAREDVSIIAKKYGGGGHRNASGITMDNLPWEGN